MGLSDPTSPPPSIDEAELWRLVAARSRDIVLVYEANGDLVYASPGLEARTGFTFDEWQRLRKTGAIHHPDDRRVIEEWFGAAMAGGSDVARIGRIATKSGAWLTVEGSLTAVQAEDGTPRYYVLHAVDVTDREQARAAREDSEDRLETVVPKAAGARSHGSLVTNHALVLARIDANPTERLAEIAAAVGISERAVHSILNDLVDAGIVTRDRVGRGNHYAIREDRALPHPLISHATVRDLLVVLRREGRR